MISRAWSHISEQLLQASLIKSCEKKQLMREESNETYMCILSSLVHLE